MKFGFFLRQGFHSTSTANSKLLSRSKRHATNPMKPWTTGTTGVAANGSYCTHDLIAKPNPFVATIDDHCFHVEPNARPADFDPKRDLIHEHDCQGQSITDWQACDGGDHSITGDFEMPIGTVFNFCHVFFRPGEDSFKNDVDKRRLVLM